MISVRSSSPEAEAHKCGGDYVYVDDYADCRISFKISATNVDVLSDLAAYRSLNWPKLGPIIMESKLIKEGLFPFIADSSNDEK